MSKQSLPNIETNFPDWYNSVVYEAELVDQAPIKGCIVIRPYGYAIWENIQKVLDKKFKETGHHNAAFPLLIPQSFIQRESKHVLGFAPELAIVTHAGGKKLKEPLVVRPTSETVIHYMFARWIKSWRDLPMKVNQWCSVIRWEKRPRPFLRTSEFWWQEGHTAHETALEAKEEVEMMRDIYHEFMENYLAIPVVAAIKPEHEKFPGADITYTLEAFMHDAKALQMGTSHVISQNFAKAFEMKFQDREEKLSYPHLTSWGVSTRMIGGIIMTHGDQKGLILPPKIAPIQVIIVPIFKEKSKEKVLSAANEITKKLKQFVRVEIDIDDSITPGAKYYKWELKGVPLRIEIGPRDLEKEKVVLVDRLGISKENLKISNLTKIIQDKLTLIQKELYNRALKKRDEQWTVTNKKLDEIGPELLKGGKFYQVGWAGNKKAITELKKYQGTIRCILPTNKMKICFYSGKPSKHDILIAKVY